MKNQIQDILEEWDQARIERHRILEYDPGQRYFLCKLFYEINGLSTSHFKEEYYHDPAVGRGVYHTYSKVGAACLWVEDQAEIIYDSLCVQKDLCNKIGKISLAELLALVFDAIQFLGFPAMTLSVLLSKYGIQKVCGCQNGVPKRGDTNVFSSLTKFYFKDAVVAQPSAHYESFLHLARLYVRKGKTELASKRLRDCEVWLRGEKVIKLPEDLEQKLIQTSPLQENFNLKWDENKIANDFPGSGILLLKAFQTVKDKLNKENKPDATKARHASVLNDIAYEYININQLGYAKRLLEEALVELPEDAYTLDSIGWLHYKLGHYPKAKDYISQAYSHDKSNHPEIRYHMVCALIRMGETKEAETILAIMKNDNRTSPWINEAEKVVDRSAKT